MSPPFDGGPKSCLSHANLGVSVVARRARDNHRHVFRSSEHTSFGRVFPLCLYLLGEYAPLSVISPHVCMHVCMHVGLTSLATPHCCCYSLCCAWRNFVSHHDENRPSGSAGMPWPIPMTSFYAPFPRRAWRTAQTTRGSKGEWLERRVGIAMVDHTSHRKRECSATRLYI